jgi:PAS domain S-box-containing protein
VTTELMPAGTDSRLAAIVRSSHDAIIGKTLNGVITDWNPGAARLYGYEADEIVGQPAAILFPPDQRGEEAAIVAAVRRGELFDRYRAERVRKDGSRVTVWLTVSPIIDERGQMVGVASISRAVSNAEVAEAKFLGVLEAAPDAIVAVDEGGRIMLANAQAARLTGYARDELIGRTVDLLVPDNLRSRHAGFRNRYARNPTNRPMGGFGQQLMAQRKDGTRFPADISLSSVRTDDGLLVAAAIRDATERLAAQAEHDRLKALAEEERLARRLQQAQRLESLGQLAGGVAHDFNNLLAVIVNYTAFVAEDVSSAAAAADSDRWAQVERDVEQIQRAADRGITLTHQLLAFGRREVARPRVIGLNTVIAEVYRMLGRSLGEHVELRTELHDDLWSIRADPAQLEQVLVNLAVNARDAMPGGGTIVVSTDNVVLGTETNLPAGRYVRLRLTDTGAGMPPEVAARAFEPFFTTKPKGEGTGLGLATVYGIVTESGGDVQIASEPGVGTSFILLLPATDEAVQQAEVRPAADRRGGGETIVVCEDEPAIREVIRRILDRHGYQVIICDGGTAAIEQARQYDGPIHLLLTDVVMPKMLGKDVAEAVRTERADVKVLYVSGYARPVLAGAGTLDAGVNLLEKPFSEEVLLAAVREVLDG